MASFPPRPCDKHVSSAAERNKVAFGGACAFCAEVVLVHVAIMIIFSALGSRLFVNMLLLLERYWKDIVLVLERYWKI